MIIENLILIIEQEAKAAEVHTLREDVSNSVLVLPTDTDESNCGTELW